MKQMKYLSAAALSLTAAFSVFLGGGSPLLPAQEAAQNTPPAGSQTIDVSTLTPETLEAARNAPPPGSKIIDFDTLSPEAQKEFLRDHTVSWTTGPDGLPSGTEEFNKARDEIVNHADPLTYDEFFEITGRYDLSMPESSELWRLMIERQNPPISIDELKTLYERKRDSIKTFYAVFRDGDKTLTFALKGDDQLYLEEEDRSKVSDDDAARDSTYRTIRAQNKSDYRQVSFYTLESGEERSSAQLMPRSDFSAGQCYRWENPLTISKIACPGSSMSRDMAEYLEERNDLRLFEKPEIIDGHRCLVLTNSNEKVCLDADRDYCVYAVFLHSRLEKSKWGGGYISRHTSEPTRKTILHGLKDYGGGVWLPSRAETVSYAEDGSIESEKEIVYDKIKINRRIRDSFFEDVIPEDAMVMDEFRVMDYKWHDRKRLGIPVQGRSVVRHQRVYRSICVAIGLALIAAGAFAKWRKHRLADGQA